LITFTFVPFDILAWSENSTTASKQKKRDNSGHVLTKGYCLDCFQKKKKYTLSRFNNSTVQRHIETSHGGIDVLVVRENDSRATHALRALKKMQVLR
jgi:hypothetical protein